MSSIHLPGVSKPPSLVGKGFGRRIVIGLCSAWLLSAPLPGSAQLADDFNDEDDVGWMRYDPIGAVLMAPQNQWDFPEGAYRLRAGPTPNPALGPGRVGSLRADAVYSEFFIQADVTAWNNNLTEAFGIVARIQPDVGPGTTDGYIFGYVTRSVAGPYATIVRIVNESTRSITGSAPVPVTLDPEKNYRFVFQGKGQSLQGFIYELPNLAAPIAAATASDSSFQEGTAGLLAFSLNSTTPEGVDVTFDNYFSRNIVPPHLLLENLGFGELRLSWPEEVQGFSLQCADTPTAEHWTDVASSLIAVFDGRWTYTTTSAEADKKFFRLFRP